jgi:hypothetical protein
MYLWKELRIWEAEFYICSAMDNTRLPKKAKYYRPQERGDMGRPVKRWSNQYEVLKHALMA